MESGERGENGSSEVQGKKTAEEDDLRQRSVKRSKVRIDRRPRDGGGDAVDGQGQSAECQLGKRKPDYRGAVTGASAVPILVEEAEMEEDGSEGSSLPVGVDENEMVDMSNRLKPRIIVLPAEIEAFRRRWSSSLIVKVLGKKVSLIALRQRLHTLWAREGKVLKRDIMFEKGEAHSSVKDLDFSHDGKFLVSLGNSGPCRVWEVASSTTVASLSKEKDERFGFCRFSQLNDGTQVLYITAVTGRGASILTWNTSSWKRISSKHLVRDSINAFNVSADGRLLAVGTGEGDILILDSTSMRVRTFVKKAHLGFVTALSFSHDSRAVVSVSMDASAQVTQVEDKKASRGLSLWAIILILLLAVAVYFTRNSVLPFAIESLRKVNITLTKLLYS